MSLAPFGFALSGQRMPQEQAIDRMMTSAMLNDPFMLAAMMTMDQPQGGFEATRSPVSIVRARSCRCDVVESPVCCCIMVELPGVAPEDINVEIADDRLLITAEHKRPEQFEGEGAKTCTYHRMERPESGSLRRGIQIPECCDKERVVTKYSNGLLTISFQKKGGEEGPKKLAVNCC